MLKNTLKKIVLITLNATNRSSSVPNHVKVFFESLFAKLRSIKIIFRFDNKTSTFKAEQNGLIRYFTNPSRGFHLYRDGLIFRGEYLFNSYCLGNVSFSHTDVVIDCGANYGDLFIKLEKMILPQNYIAVEPNPKDFEVLKSNLPENAILINSALGNKSEIMKFYISEVGGDSSLVEPPFYEKLINIDVLRLDELIRLLNLERVKLLKLEAEGFEPEILEGLGEKIRICQYIAVDGGYERGKEMKQTLTQVTNYLFSNKFELVDIFFPWHRALFMNTDLAPLKTA